LGFFIAKNLIMTTIRKILITKKRIKRAIELKDWTMIEVEKGYLKCLREILSEEKGIRNIEVPLM